MSYKPNKGQEKLQHTGWTTDDELEFIDGIGRDKNEEITNRPSISGHIYTMSRSHLLLNYLVYVGKRVNWGTIKASVVIDHTEKALQAEGYKT